MNTPTSKSQDLAKLALKKKQQEADAWYKIVVKVIQWQDIKTMEQRLPVKKISLTEWQQYCDKMLSISVTWGKSKTLEKLKDTENLIKKHRGFE